MSFNRIRKPHDRKCHDCGNVAIHLDFIVPDVICQKCGSQDTRLIRKPVCKECGGQGSVDSGGFTPDGRSIDVPCMECQPI
jgi:hypothetical protein